MKSNPAFPCAFCVVLFCLGLPCVAAKAQDAVDLASPSNYGGAGILDTRTARFFSDGDLIFGGLLSRPDDRYALTFQGLPWAELTFRYSINRGIPDANYSLHDRSFDIKVRLSNENEYFPELALGVQDFLGTGVYSGEYLVGSKHWNRFDFSLGLGWGRLASRGAFENPFRLFGSHFDTRSIQFGLGGVPLFNTYFRGPDVGVFGGIVYDTPIENFKLKLEYSSDAYVAERNGSGRDYSYPWNVGISYRAWSWLDVGVSLLHGRDIGLRISTIIDPTKEIWPVRLDPAPRFRARPEQTASTILTRMVASSATKVPVETRFVDLTSPSQATAGPQSLSQQPSAIAISPAVPLESQEGANADDYARLRAALGSQKIAILGLSLEGDRVRTAIENATYRNDSEAIARTARVFSAAAPPNIEYFEITVTRAGQPVTTVTLPRTEIDKIARSEGSAAELFHASDLSAASESSLDHLQPGLFPQFDYSINPIFRQAVFDPDNPFYVEFGVGAFSVLRLARSLFVQGFFAASLYDDFNDIKRQSNSTLPHVRSDFADYLKKGKYRLETFEADYYYKLNPVIYGRVSAGILEWMYAGVGGELLYRPFGRRWALGADLWAVQQRDFNGLFGLRDYRVITGHVTAYYALPWHDIHLAASAGQYLAGDRGVTFEAFRRFSSGVEVGAWFSLTNVSAAQFGEGSFDKGIRIYIPLEWAAPFPTRSGYELGVRPISRDGGQMLLGDRALYKMTDSPDYGLLSEQWNSVFSDRGIGP